ncbi:AraC family transcriptional regulator [Marinicellulosiphila megalodicopiae]|uniref:AraC family transcriptional regulator n=1 Tax=Marinicellulosiphila megalodicopiae TaxID=2724896 RepID=UPI003BB08817
MPDIPILIQYILAIGIFQGLLISYLLIAHPHTSIASRILGVWCLLFALSFTSPMIYTHGLNTPLVYIFGWLDFFPAIYGAILYLYCRQSFSKQRFKKLDILHASAFILMLALNYEILFASYDTRMAYITNHQTQSIIHPLSQYLLYAQAYIYMMLATRLTLKNQKRAQAELANFHPKTFSWIKTLLLFNVIIWSLKLIAYFNDYWMSVSFIADTLIVMLIYVIGLAQWKNPGIFQVKLEIDEPEHPPKQKTESNKTQESNFQLDHDTRASILSAAKNILINEQRFKDKDLNLQTLAQLVGVSQHHLSESINQNAGCNFYQLINQHRVDFVCEQLKNNHDLKVIDLCFEAGFSSKSTFNSVFKKYTQLTPSQFRSINKGASSE